MPAQSKQQQKFMGIVRAIQKGDQPASKFSKKAQDAADDMKKKDVEKYASTKHKGLPKKVEQALREKIRTMVEDYVESCGYVMSAEDPDYKLKSPGGTGKVDRKLKELAEKMGGCLCEKCWKGYKIHPKRKTKILFGKRYPNCVKKETKTNEGFGSDEFLTKTEKKKFEKERLENAEVLGYELTGTKDLKESTIQERTSPEEMYDDMVRTIKKSDEKKALKRLIDEYELGRVYYLFSTNRRGFFQAVLQTAALMKAKNLKESINEDGHTDVPSAVRKLKTSIEDALQIIGYLKKVNDAEPLPSWWTDKVTLSSNYLNTARNYILNPHESVFAVRQDKIKNGERFPKEPNFDYDPEKGKSRIRKVNETMKPSAIKKMRAEFERTGELPPHLKKFVKDVNILKKKHKVKNIVVPGLEWMSDMKEQSVNEARLNPKETIKQLGGNRFLYMVGAKNLAVDKTRNELHMKIMRNAKGVSHVVVKLTSLDLYDMKFLSIRAGKIRVKATEKGVYGDQLATFFKKHTGLNTRL